MNSMDGVNKELAGQAALVTGAGRGIGKAIALGFAAAGAKVSCLARTDTALQQTVAEIRAAGGEGLAISADVTQLTSVEMAFKRAYQDFGRLDILVINAGGSLERKSVEDSDPQKWADTLTLNLTGAYYCARAAIPYLKENGGKIIALGSGRGHRPKEETSAYACSKAGLWMLTRVLAEELQDYRITVNELIPGPVMTEGFQEALNGVDLKQAFPESEWIKKAEDVVPLALFLATQAPNGPTGQCFSLMRRDAL